MNRQHGPTSLPKIQQEPEGVRVFVGEQDYLLSVERQAFAELFAAGDRLLMLNTEANDREEGFSPGEVEEVRQQIIAEAIRFLVINDMPLKLSKTSFDRVGVVRTLFEKAEAKFAGSREPAFRLTARTAAVSVEEVKRVIANRDARWEV